MTEKSGPLEGLASIQLSLIPLQLNACDAVVVGALVVVVAAFVVIVGDGVLVAVAVSTTTDKNQRTIDPVNAHPISGPTVSTKTSKIHQGQPRFIIYINFVELESPIFRAKFQDHRTSGSGEGDFIGFYHIWAWRLSWLCDLYQLYKLSFPLPKDPHIKFGLDWPSGFREDV